MSKLSRRQLLQKIGVATTALSPAGLFAEAFILGLVSRANAEILDNDPRNLIAIRAPGAPARWGWDQMLNPNGETLLPNPYIASHFSASGGRLVDPIYDTIKYRGVTVPYTWSFSVPKSAGGLRPMTDLLNNMLVIRGVDIVDAGHPGAQKRQFMVPGGSASIQGTLADASKHSPLACLVIGGPNGADFLSRKSLQKIDVPVGGANQNVISDIMTPFKVNNSLPTRTLALTHGAQIQTAYAALSTVSSDLSQTLRTNVKGADDIIRSGIEDLSTAWTQLKTKYTNLIAAAIAGQYKGINDMPVGTTGTRAGEYNFDQGVNKIATLDDLRTMFNAQTTMGRTVDHFAVAEFMITRGYTNNIIIDLGSFQGLNFDKTDLTRFQNDNFDAHFIGRVLTTYLWGRTVPAFAACLLELIDVLKAKTRYDGKNLWSETVIQFSGEFNRTAPWVSTSTTNGGGTDHNPSSASFSHWSGAIQGPIVVGNIIDKNRSDYLASVQPGTIGLGAALPELGGRIAGTGDVINSLATLLRVTPPNANARSLVAADGTSLIGPPKIVPRAEG